MMLIFFDDVDDFDDVDGVDNVYNVDNVDDIDEVYDNYDVDDEYLAGSCCQRWGLIFDDGSDASRFSWITCWRFCRCSPWPCEAC